MPKPQSALKERREPAQAIDKSTAVPMERLHTGTSESNSATYKELKLSEGLDARDGAYVVPMEALRHDRIAVAAYYRAQNRGFCEGGELEDWLAAEREIDGHADGAAGPQK